MSESASSERVTENSPALRLALRFWAPQIVRAMYAGLLKREPDELGLEAYSRSLQKSGRLTDVLQSIAWSEEAWRLAFAAHSAELVRQVFIGLLKRQPDENELIAHTSDLQDPERFSAVVSAVVRYPEYLEASFLEHSLELIRIFYHELFGEKPDEETTQRYRLRLPTDRADVATTLSQIASSDEFLRKLVDRHAARIIGIESDNFEQAMLNARAPELVQAVFHGLLGRDAEPAALDQYCQMLANREGLAALIEAVANSEEFRGRFLLKLLPDLRQQIFRGILGRNADSDVLTRYGHTLTEGSTFADFVATVIDSAESRSEFFGRVKPELLRSVLRGVLAREPHAKELALYGDMLTSPNDLESVVAKVVKSAEFRTTIFHASVPESVVSALASLFGESSEVAGKASKSFLADAEGADATLKKQLVSALAPKLVESMYRGILGRAADPAGQRQYSTALNKGGTLEDVLRGLVSSAEFSRLRLKGRRNADPKETYNRETVVFLHMLKTAGSSVNQLLASTFGDENICFRNSDTIFQLSAAELSTYTAIAGHLDYDSLDYIPPRKLLVFCFVRQPRERLLSLYAYWRAHTPTHADFGKGAALANALPLEEFLMDPRVRAWPQVWNHMTWALMGERKWTEWRLALLRRPRDSQVLRQARMAIIKRLRELTFVGLQECFEESVELLFQVLGRPKPAFTPKLNALGDRMNTDPNFRKDLQMLPTGERVEAALEPLLELDTFLYEEAKKWFAARCVQLRRHPQLETRAACP